VFKREIENIIKDVEEEIPKALTSKEYENSKNLIYNTYQRKAQDILNQLNHMAKEYNFIFKQTERGILSIPLKGGRPMTDKELDELSEEEIEQLMELSNQLGQEAFDYVKKVREVEKELIEAIDGLKESKVSQVLTMNIDDLIKKYQDNPSIYEYLKDMKSDIGKNYKMFIREDDRNPIENIFVIGDRKEDFMKRYEVNLFIDNSDMEEAPVIKEMNPTYYNLFGKVEYVNELGGLRTDHTKIRAGSLHEANGGLSLIHI